MWDQKDGSAVKSKDCPSKESRFWFSASHGGFTTVYNVKEEPDTLFWPSHHYMYTYIHAARTLLHLNTKQKGVCGEMPALAVRALTALPEDLDWIPSSYAWQLTTACNCSSRDAELSSGPHRHQVHTWCTDL